MILSPLKYLFVSLKKHSGAVLLLGVVSLGLVTAANAQVTVAFTWDGTDTTANFTIATGTFAGAVFKYNGNSDSTANFANNIAMGNDGEDYSEYRFSGSSSGTVPWTGEHFSSYSGDFFVFAENGGLLLRQDYDLAIGAPLESSAVVRLNRSPSDFGFASDDSAAGSFIWSGVDVNWSVMNTTAVPEPSTYATLFGACTLGFVVFRRNRSKRAT